MFISLWVQVAFDMASIHNSFAARPKCSLTWQLRGLQMLRYLQLEKASVFSSLLINYVLHGCVVGTYKHDGVGSQWNSCDDILFRLM